MNLFEKVLAVCVVCVAATLVVRHGEAAMRPALPSDMPAQAQFLQSGYDVTKLEAQGDWVACGVDQDQGQDWCRVTDKDGLVVYQGDFLPLTSDAPLPGGELNVSAAHPEHLWVAGPGGVPEPVIPLTGGALLVPAADRAALADRWSSHPEEMAALSSR